MPQMSPLPWDTLYSTFMIILLGVSGKIYFYLIKESAGAESKSEQKPLAKINWTW